MTTQSFLGNMQSTLIGEVRSMTKYEIDANTKGGSIWVAKPNTGQNPDVLGDEIIKIKMPFEMFEQQRQKLQDKEITIPGVFEILVEINMGGQNKATLYAKSIRPYKPDLPHLDVTDTSVGTATGAGANKANNPTNKP